jgi:hypothetical protein
MSDRNWKEYNEALVRRGEILLDMEFLDNWSKELKIMNKGKEGARFRYPESFIRLLAIIHAYLLPYRQLEGFIRALSSNVEGLKVPDYTTIWWRIAKKMDIKLDTSIINSNDDIVIAVDSTGIKVANRGEWMREKWKTRRGFIKIHIAVDVKSKQITSIQVTKENVTDGKMLKSLVYNDALSKADVKKVIADGAYDSKDNFRFLSSNGIEPCIKVRKNSSTNARGCMPRKIAVIEQIRDIKWKERHGYGLRWIAESAISSLKRTFGEYVSSIRWGNIVKELILKASIYNIFIRMNSSNSIV